MRVPSRSYRAGLGVLVLSALLAACGGGGVNTTPVPQTLPSSATVTTGTFAATSVPQLGIGDVTVLSAIPTTSAVAQITETLSIEPFSDAGALSVTRKTAEATRSPQLAGATNYLYVRFVSDSSVTIAGTPGISFTLPAIASGASYYLAQRLPSGWQAPAEGPGVVRGTSVSFAINTANSIAIAPGAPITVALYSVPNTGPSPAPSASPSAGPTSSASAGPTASPTASPTPSPTPVPTPVLAPAALAFDASNPSMQNFSVTETNNTAAITAAISCTAGNSTPVPAPEPTPTAAFIAQLNTTSATPSAGVATFTVTSGDFPGNCVITATDTHGATATGTVSVNASTINVFSHRRDAR